MQDTYTPMEIFDLVLFTAFTPVFCLTFIIVLDVYTAYAMRRRFRNLCKYQPDLLYLYTNDKTREEALSGKHHA